MNKTPELGIVEALAIPRQLIVWFSMYQQQVQDMHSYLLATQARDSLELFIPRLPELRELIARDTTGLIMHVYTGGLAPQKLPVVCLACGQIHDTAIGGRIVNHCGIGDTCAADYNKLSSSQRDRIAYYHDIVQHTDYGEDVVGLFYLTWLALARQQKAEV
jgi:hypothetical protein